MDSLPDEEPVAPTVRKVERQKAEVRGGTQPEKRKPEDGDAIDLERRLLEHEVPGRRDRSSFETDRERRPEARTEREPPVAPDDDSATRPPQPQPLARKVKRRGIDAHVAAELELAGPRVERHVVGPHLEGRALGARERRRCDDDRPRRERGARSVDDRSGAHGAAATSRAPQGGGDV